jgi:F-type H+-transporting ATPase subunit b
MRGMASFLGAALLAAPAVALAAGGGEHGGEGHGGNALWHAVNLILLVGVLVYVGRKPLQEFFSGRRREIEANLQRSAALLAEAESRLGEWNRRMQRLDQEVEEIRQGARERAAAERDRILADAQVAAERVRRDAGAAIDQETRRARNELRQEATALALDLASDLLRQRMTAEDRTRLVDEFIQKVESSPAGAARS